MACFVRSTGVVPLGEMLRRQLQEVEGEFEVIEKTSGEAKSAA
jgi:hypothetical protein